MRNWYETKGKCKAIKKRFWGHPVHIYYVQIIEFLKYVWQITKKHSADNKSSKNNTNFISHSTGSLYHPITLIFLFRDRAGACVCIENISSMYIDSSS